MMRMPKTNGPAFSAWRLLSALFLSALLGWPPACLGAEVVDFAHIDCGTTVHAVSEGVNPPPYDVRGAIGDGSHLSYPGALPNWFELDLGQVRSIKAIDIDWRYSDKSPDDFDISFGLRPGQWDTTLQVRDIGGQGQYWYRVLGEAIQARYVRMEVLSLHNYQWTVINRISLYGTSRVPRLMRANGERYEWLAETLGGLKARAQEVLGVVPGPLAAAYNEADNLHGLLAGKGEITGDQWQSMQGAFGRLHGRAYAAQAQMSFAALRRATEAPVVVGAVGAMVKVFRDIWPEQIADELRLRCARNEREAGQVILAAPGQDLQGVQVSVDPLVGPRELQKAIEPGLVCYIRTKDAPYLTHHVGLWPDGISPLARFDLPQGQVQPIWLTVAVPEDAPAGEYQSTVRIRAQGVDELRVPVRLTVWDFALPKRPSLPNVFSLSSLRVGSWYRNKDLTWDDLKQDYYDFWIEHRLNPTSLYGQMVPPAEDLDESLIGGMNTFVIKYIYSGGGRQKEEYFQACLADLAKWDEILAKRDLYDKAIVYLADEPAQKASVTAEINRRARIIHQRFPKMRRMLVLTRPVDRAFDESVDIWCPIVGKVRPEDVEEAHRRGELCWWYSVGSFFNLDMPAVAARSMPWLTFSQDLDGILYWAIQSSWRKPNRPTQFHPEPGETIWEGFQPAGHGGQNGIGNLCYPGSDGRPWSSQRLELLREGLEDYEYLVLLRKTLADAPESRYAALLDAPNGLATKYAVGTDWRFITRRRDQIGEALSDLLARE